MQLDYTELRSLASDVAIELEHPKSSKQILLPNLTRSRTDDSSELRSLASDVAIKLEHPKCYIRNEGTWFRRIISP